MIPSAVTYTNNDGISISFGSVDYPLTSFSMPTITKNEPVDKVQFPGRWPTYAYPEYREFHLGGDILGDDNIDYNTLLRAMKLAIQPPYRTYTARRHGKLDFVFYGDAVHYYSYVILNDFDSPKEANYPSVGVYTCTFSSFEPYLINATTGAFALDY